MFRMTIVLSLALVGSACKKDAGATAGAKAEPVTAPLTAGKVGADGVRRVEVEANDSGYTPARITGKPGEKLDLVVTRTSKSECISQLKAPDGKLVDLPQGKPVEIAVVVPARGEAGFSCGMDMFHGAVVATP